MKETANAPANIAFIKYWGKEDKELRLPANNSISMNLSDVYTTTSVEFEKNLKKDTVYINEEKVKDRKEKRVVKHLDRIREIAGISEYARVESTNNFPSGAGIASSASGFAALTLAATKAADLNLNEKKLSVLARLGSGSACRSIPDGIVEWRAGNSSETSFAHSLFPETHWKLADVVTIVQEEEKKVSSTSGHDLAPTSPFYATRIKNMPLKIREIKKAIKDKDFSLFGEIIEEEAINMHTVMMTSTPPLFYWNAATVRIINAVREWRDNGLSAYFTIDAGPNMHIICQEKDIEKVKTRLKKINGVKRVIVNYPARGASLI